MTVCCASRCSSRTTVMIVAVISALHFMMETAAIVFVGEQHRLVLSSDSGHFYSIAGSQIFMIIFSILLFAGAYTRIIWLCFPWLVLTILNVVYHIYIVIVLAMKSISHFDTTKLEMMILLSFSGMVLSYMAWLVVKFITDVRGGGFGGSRDEEDSFPLMSKT